MVTQTAGGGGEGRGVTQRQPEQTSQFPSAHKNPHRVFQTCSSVERGGEREREEICRVWKRVACFKYLNYVIDVSTVINPAAGPSFMLAHANSRLHGAL